MHLKVVLKDIDFFNFSFHIITITNICKHKWIVWYSMSRFELGFAITITFKLWHSKANLTYLKFECGGLPLLGNNVVLHLLPRHAIKIMEISSMWLREPCFKVKRWMSIFTNMTTIKMLLVCRMLLYWITTLCFNFMCNVMIASI